jgi:hypothetical protein
VGSNRRSSRPPSQQPAILRPAPRECPACLSLISKYDSCTKSGHPNRWIGPRRDMERPIRGIAGRTPVHPSTRTVADPHEPARERLGLSTARFSPPVLPSPSAAPAPPTSSPTSSQPWRSLPHSSHLHTTAMSVGDAHPMAIVIGKEDTGPPPPVLPSASVGEAADWSSEGSQQNTRAAAEQCLYTVCLTNCP